MKKAIAIVIQILIFVGAWFVMSPDVIEDNTHLFGLIGDLNVTKGNTDWVMMTAGILSVFNIWVWWPKSTTLQTVAEAAKGTLGTEAKETDRDPKTPDLS